MDSRSLNVTTARYRTLRKERRERRGGGSFINTAVSLYSNYMLLG